MIRGQKPITVAAY